MFRGTALAALVGSLAAPVSDRAASPRGIDFEQVFASGRRAPTFAHPHVQALFSTSSATDLEPATTGAIAALPPAPDPWWVVVASLRDPGDYKAPTETVRDRISKCGLETAAAPSSRFVGFRPGYVAVVIGPLPTKNDAVRVLEAARPCAADANIRQAKQAAE